MALRNQPYLPLYVQDFLTDEKLIECSAKATGVYIRIMCILHKNDDYGCILLKQKDKQTSSNIKNFAIKLAKQLPYDLEEIESSLIELIDEKVLILEDDLLYQKRMRKDGNLSDKRAKAGLKGANKKNANSFAKDFAMANNAANNEAKHLANSEYENEIENEYENDINKKEKSKRKEETKISYAEFVNMTKTEYQKLINSYGEVFTKECINVLDNYKGSSGKKYKSDYRAILSWVVNEVKKRVKVRPKESNEPTWFNKNIVEKEISDERKREIEEIERGT